MIDLLDAIESPVSVSNRGDLSQTLHEEINILPASDPASFPSNQTELFPKVVQF